MMANAQNSSQKPSRQSGLYRRCPGEQAQVRNVPIDKRRVIPYHPYFSLKYNAHINVEVVTSVRAIKYIYKKIVKGFDSINNVVTSEGRVRPKLGFGYGFGA